MIPTGTAHVSLSLMVMDYIPVKKPTRTSQWSYFWYHAFLHGLSFVLAATAVALFPAFAYKPWSVSIHYDLKTTQQYVNFVVIACALLLSWLLQHCPYITNKAEAEAEFASKDLSLAALQTRTAANDKDVIDMLRYAVRNSRLWYISAPFALAITVFSAMSWVLSIVFVLDSRLVPGDNSTNVSVTLGGDVPALPDACRSSLTAAGCTYDLAMSALTSQLITHTPYTFDNITFSGAEGTMGLPSSEIEYMSTQYDTFLKINYDTYRIVINPNTGFNQTYVLTSSNGDGGVMTVARSELEGETALSILTASGQYANLLSQLAVGKNATFEKEAYNETQFTVLCDSPFNDDIYSWRWIEFSLDGGVMTTNSANETCRDDEGKSPMQWLDYALEGATASAQLRDGYSKLLNTDYLDTTGDDYERMQAYNMSPLEYILSHIEMILQTAWTATNGDIAATTSVEQQPFEHRYVVTVEIKNVTILALAVACIILLCTILQIWRWLRAERKAAKICGSTWQPLDPVQLLIYGAHAAESVQKLDLANGKQRADIVRDRYSPMMGFGPGTLVPRGEATSAHELRKRPTHSRTISSSSSVYDEPEERDGEELPSWDNLQARGQQDSGLRPLILRSPNPSREDGFV
ncbi:hypothetical protein CLAFUR0_11864 [Fulvia fulva]|nr:hypothetical protein CLAFUR0_11864 [Fulvia fulva]